MTEAWRYAQRRSSTAAWQTHRQISTVDILKLGYLVEREKNAEGFRRVGVRAGTRHCPDPEDAPRLIENLLTHGGELEPVEWYKEYELIHPFRDGNGRSGKCLLNWLSDTLGAPYFPPSDLFGAPILNP